MELINKVNVYENYAFHVHTYRCKHAGTEKEEEYILRAVELGKEGIIFTDHAPFPGDPFGNRMDMAKLPEYLSELRRLKEMYRDRIQVGIGLEIEYLPGYEEYYRKLAAMEDMEWLILGQHMYEHRPGEYSFSDPNVIKDAEEYRGLCNAMIAGMETGLFRVVAHPDRAFRRRKAWDKSMEELSQQLIKTAIRTGTILEQNMASRKERHHYWNEFWETLDCIEKDDPGMHAHVIRGLDAHSVAELE